VPTGRVTSVPTTVTHPPTLRAVLGDLTIRQVNDVCGFYTDTDGGLWINPTLRVGWTGPGPFPAAGLGFSMTTSPGNATAGGPVTSTNPFTWAIGVAKGSVSSWLGHTVVITVTIDPGNVVPESNESNNVTTITVAVPGTPPSNPNGTIACHA
jgi:hypothetical protein